MVQPVSDDPLNDIPDGVPPNPEQPGDRCLGHLLGQPRHHVLKVTCVMRCIASPRDRFQVHAAVQAAKATQLALDHAPRRAETFGK